MDLCGKEKAKSVSPLVICTYECSYMPIEILIGMFGIVDDFLGAIIWFH